MRHYGEFDEGYSFAHDQFFPLRTKTTQDPQRLETNIEADADVGSISGETEMIARISYRLGHAEAIGIQSSREARRERGERKETAEKLSEVTDSHRYYKNRVGEAEEAITELRATIEKKDKQLDKLKGKGKKNARRSRSKNK